MPLTDDQLRQGAQNYFSNKPDFVPRERKQVTDWQRSKVENTPKPKPFMATSTTSDGMPIYGTGFHGWVRKLWADIADPAKLLADTQKLSQSESNNIWDSYNARVEESGAVIEDKLRWGSWGEKIFGISSEEVAALTAGGKYERETAEQLGESQVGTAISRSWAIARDTTQNAIWGGLDLLSLDDTLVRKVIATTQGVDAVADKFNKDEPKNFFQEFTQLGAVSFMKDVGTLASAVLQRKTTFKQVSQDVLETTRTFRAGSAMAYTMVFDSMRRDEFERRVSQGADPHTTAVELGLLSTEITGSILGSPSTYLGLNIKAPINLFTKAGRESGEIIKLFGRNVELFGNVQRLPWRNIASIPTFGEILGLNIGKAKLFNETKRFTESAIPEIENVLRNADKVTGDKQALNLLENAATAYATKLDDMSKHKKWWDLSALDTNGKISVTTRDSSNWIQNLVSREGIDTSLQIMRDMVIVRRGGEDAVRTARNLLSRNNANILTSPVALMTSEIIHRLDADNIFDVITTNKNNPIKMHDELFTKLNNALRDFIPSVDEMFDAKAYVDDIGKNLPTDTAELSKYSRQKELADRLDSIPQIVKTVNRLTRVPEAITKKTTAAMAYTFMNLVPRSWNRNIFGQFWGIAAQQGMKNALETTMVAYLGINKKLSTSFVDSTKEQIVKRIGFDIAQSAKKLGDFAESKTKGIFSIGMMPAIGRSEDITSYQIMLNSVNDTLSKALPVTLKNLPEYDNLISALPKEQQGLMTLALERTYGDFDEATKLFRQWTGTGEIDAWRLTKPSPYMQKELERWGLMDKFNEVQQGAKSVDEFKAFIDNFITTYSDEVTKNAQNLPSTLRDLPSELNDWGEDLAKNVPEKVGNVIRELMQGWENTFKKVNENTHNILRSVEDKIFSLPDPAARQQLRTAYLQIEDEIRVIQGTRRETFKTMDTVRTEVVDLIKRVQKMTPQEIKDTFSNFKVVYGGKSVFSFSKIYPNIDLKDLSPNRIKGLMWDALFEETAMIYKNSNLGIYNRTLDKLQDLTSLFGSSLDEVASGGDALREQDDLLKITMKIEDAFSWQRLFRSVSFKPEIDQTQPVSKLVDDYKKAFPDWNGTPAYILNNTNKSLGSPAQGNSVASLANRFGIASTAGDGVAKVANKDNYILNIINDYVKKSIGDVNDVKKYEKGKNALKSIAEIGGINQKEFSDIMGGVLGVDKQGVMPSLFTKNGLGIDDVATRLVEDGYLTADQASDLNFVRDFIRTFSTKKTPMDETISSLELQDIAKGYSKLDDVPLGVAEDAFRSKTGIKESITALPNKVDKTKPYYTSTGNLVTPIDYNNMTIAEAIQAFSKTKRIPPYDGGYVNEARTMWEGLQKFTTDIRDWGDTVLNDWGTKVKTIPTDVEGLLEPAKKAFNDRWGRIQLEASVIAESQRNFMLHDYNKSYFDHALTYLLGNSFHYWTTRTFQKSLETLIDNPKYANIYLQYKEYLQERHSDMPEFYRQNLQINSLFGIDLGNPYYVNLESMINPVYSLTGTDFNDPRKRVDWLSRTIDDMGKFGVGFSPLIQWAVAMHLYNKGEEEAATRWTNRLLPQSQIIKSGTAMVDNLLEKVGIDFDTSAVEIDPFANFLNGGVDPYEENRIAAALATMVRNGDITAEQMIEVSRLKEGDLWERAKEISAENRFAGDFTSFFFGAGIRPRTQDDMVIEKFWGDYGTLIASRDLMTPEQYRQEWDNLRDNAEYGEFVDALLISRKSGTEQDTAYAYNVFGRIPPGQLTAVADAVGINSEMIEAFYDSKGDFEEMGLTGSDLKRFMAGVADLGAILALPDSPTRQEWTQARIEYSDVNEALKQNFGDDILQKIDVMYDADNQDDYLELHPEVQMALNAQSEMVLNSPVLDLYYGGIDKLEAYYRAKTKQSLRQEFGDDIMDLAQEYNDPTTSIERSKELKNVLKKYFARKKQLETQNERVLADFALRLPDRPTPVSQEDVIPQGEAQNNLYDLTASARTMQEWEGVVGNSSMQFIQEFAYGGDEVPSAVMRKLDWIAENEGYYNGQDMMNQIIMTLPQVTQ